MTRVPVHKGIGDHSAPAAILSDRASHRLGPSDPTWHNTGTTADTNTYLSSPAASPTARRDLAAKARTGSVGGPVT